MRLIAVVADTHVPTRANDVPIDLLRDLEEHEPYKIFHAGDLVAEAVIDEFEFIAPTHVVKGNNDGDLDLPHEFTETIEQTKIAMRHRPDTVDINQFAAREEADIVIYGHTHAARIEEKGEFTIVNPGSPTVPRQGEPSYALISIEEQQFDAWIEGF